MQKKALELLNVIPGIILLDINMPEMDGLELCQLIRGHISCPIILLTARVMERGVIKGLSVGGDDYIAKPFSMDELLARISAHLRREERKGVAENLRFNEELIIDYNSRTVFYGKKPLDFSNGDSNSIINQEGICQGYFHPSHLKYHFMNNSSKEQPAPSASDRSQGCWFCEAIEKMY